MMIARSMEEGIVTSNGAGNAVPDAGLVRFLYEKAHVCRPGCQFWLALIIVRLVEALLLASAYLSIQGCAIVSASSRCILESGYIGITTMLVRSMLPLKFGL
jgi:hypothetical protein